MNRFYLGKKNVENKFQFYQMVQTIITSYLFLTKVENLKLDNKIRRDLYNQFIQKNILGLYIITDRIENYIRISFAFKGDEEESSFGSIKMDLNES